MRAVRISLCFLVWGGACAQQFVVSTYAGGTPPPTPVAALNAGIGFPQNLATDASGNLYFANLNCVFRLDRNGVLNRIAGNSLPGFSGDGGPALDAQIFLSANRPIAIWDPNYHGGVAVDRAGNVYIADTGNNRIRKISNGIITTVAGNGKFASSGDGGPAADAQLFGPITMAVDGAGNLFVAENFGRVRKISPNGIISTAAGGGTSALGDGGLATNARVGLVVGVAVDGKGNLYLADRDAGRIRKVSTDGVITTVAGGGANDPGEGGAAAGAQLYAPSSVAVDGPGNLYFSDYDPKIDDWVVFKVSTDGTISMLVALYASAMATDSDGNLYLARSGFVSEVSPAGTVTTIAGNGYTSYFSGDGGPATAAQLNTPWGVAVDSAGNVYIADSFNNRVRKVSPDGTITTAAGNGAYGYSGDGGKAIDALLSGPVALAVDAADNLYIADLNNNAIRKVSPAGMITTVAGTGVGGYSGDGGPAVSARLFNPRGVAVDRDGDLYIADYYNRRIRKVSPDGMITTVAGNGGAGYSGDGGPATSAQVVADSVAVDSAGALYLPYNLFIRKVSLDGIITTVAGTPLGNGDSGDGVPVTGAAVFATGMAIDGAGNWYITDVVNRRIRKISPDGIITTIAGTGSYGYSGDGGPALSAQFGEPFALAIDRAGSLFVVDRYYSVVRRLQPVASSSPGNGANQ